MTPKPKGPQPSSKASTVSQKKDRAALPGGAAAFWLMKTEPEVFSFDDLMAAPHRITSWEGVRNYQARNFMRDDMKNGDLVFIYHSNTEEPGVQGIARVSRRAYADPFQWDPKSPYYDDTAPREGDPRWVMVDVQGQKKFKRLVSLLTLKGTAALEGMVLLQKGSRLSVQPVQPEHWQIICKMGGV